MKKINKNIFVFIVAFLLIIHGMFSTDYFKAMKNSVKELIRNPKGQSVGDRVDTFISKVDTSSSKKLKYYNECIDINSVLLKATNTRVVKKTQDTVIKLDDGTLTKVAEEVPDSIFEKCSQNVAKLQKDSDIPLLYVVAPFKGEGDGIPENAQTFANNNSDRFLVMLREKGVNTLDLREKMKEQGITSTEMFFKTDHHWEPKGGFWANGEICKKLNRDYGFEYNKDSINKDGIYLIQNEENQEVWLYIGGTLVNLLGEVSDNYVTYLKNQDVDADSKFRALSNIGLYYETLNDAIEAKLTSGIINGTSSFILKKLLLSITIQPFFAAFGAYFSATFEPAVKIA